MIATRLKQNKGMSMVELMVTMSILGMVMIPLSYILYFSYNTYYQENDKMNCLAEVNDTMEMIIDDLRKYEFDDNTTIVSPSAITITTGVNFTLDIPNKTILRSGVSTLSGNNQTEILGFLVAEKNEAGYDTTLIELTVTAQCVKSGIITLTNSYRRKN